MFNKIRFHLFRYSYTLLYALCLPIYATILIRKYKDTKPIIPFRQHFNLGVLPTKEAKIWIHCASFGEAQGISQLIKKLIQEKQKIIITTLTASGAAVLEKKFKSNVMIRYLPFDLPFLIQNFHKTHKIKLLLLMEKELWPNLITHTKKKKIPILLMNARLDERSLKRYNMIKSFSTTLLKKCQHIACVSQKDKNNFKILNIEDKKLSICENLKLDIQLKKEQIQQSQILKTNIDSRLILSAVSTHKGEESIIIDLWKNLIKKHPNLLLILIPRHPHRVESIQKLCKTFITSLHSQQKKPSSKDQIYIVDTLGEAISFINISDLILMGGSWVPIGGHNFLEAALLEKCILVGPYMSHFQEIFENFLENNAIIQETQPVQLYKQCHELLKSPKKRQNYGQKAKNIAMNKQGSTEKHWHQIKKLLTYEKSI